jgi:hypothetical protein
MPPVPRRRSAGRPIERAVKPPPGDLRHAAAALALLWAVCFAPQLFLARLFVIGDASAIRAFAEFSSAHWQEAHERTHWNPYILGGVASGASLQDSRPQWLPDPLLTAFDAVHRLPGFPPLLIPLLVHLAGMIAVAALARALWRARTLAMIWAGAAWGLLPGLLVPFAFGQDWVLMSATLVPVILLAVHLVCFARAPRARLAAALGLALSTGALFLAAHPQIIALAIPLTALFALERVAAARRPTALLDLGLATVLGAAMGTAAWWPAYLYNTHSIRGGAAGGVLLSEVERWSAGLPDLVALVWPWAAGFGSETYWGGLGSTDFPQFLGTTVACLGLLGLARRDENGRAALLFLVAGLIAVILSLGLRLGPLYEELYRHLPLWSTFRVAVRTLIVTQLAFALLSARGLEWLLEAQGRSAGRWLRIGAAVAALGVLLALLLRGPLADAFLAAARAARPSMDGATLDRLLRSATFDLLWRALVLGALPFAAWLALRPRGRWAGALAIGLLALDLGAVSAPFLRRATGTAERLQPPPPLIARLAAADPRARLIDVTRSRVSENDWIRWRARSFTGNHPAVPRIWDDILSAGLTHSYPVMCALAIRWLGGANIGPTPDTTRFELGGRDELGVPVWRLRQALPRAYAVPRVTWRTDERAVMAALAAPDFDPLRDVSTSDSAAAGEYPGSAGCRIRWLDDQPDHLTLELAEDAAAFVVIADDWFPGWTATLDGRPWPLHQVQHLLRGAALPAGTHRLRLAFQPEGWTAAVLASRSAWGLWLLAALLAWWLSRAAPPPGEREDRPGHPQPVHGESGQRPQRR